MTEKTGAPDAWTGAWTTVQKEYMDAWLAMASQMTSTQSAPKGASKAASEPLAQGLEFWTKMMAPALRSSPDCGTSSLYAIQLPAII